ncbi:MAG TPA: hypothetical protein VFG36_00150 [Methanoregula sp.]|nr:hypothetical protein [Methanoregula sp.]
MTTETAGTMKQSDDEGYQGMQVEWVITCLLARAGAGSDTAYQEKYALRKRSDADLPVMVQDVFNKPDNG